MRGPDSQPGYKSRIDLYDTDYFNLSEKEVRAAQSSGYKDYPTLEQVHKIIFSMPSNTEIEKRNQALVAFTILTGIRDGAIASLKLKHITLEPVRHSVQSATEALFLAAKKKQECA